MKNEKNNIYVGSTQTQREVLPVEGSYVQLFDETYYRIRHYDQMPPFFMSLVSSADHWLFIAGTGGLTAGRINADSALFPYETEDKITAHSEQTGAKTILRVAKNERTYLWEPFSIRYAGLYRCERHLYKNIYGNKLVFEEINHDLQLTMRYAWRTSDRFGFIKSSWLQNDGDHACRIDLLDGLQNLLPYGATNALQTTFSSLLNGYKRNELDAEAGLGLFALSATLTDQAEPSESLQATTVWQTGLDDECHLLCTDQLDAFRYGRPLTPEVDVQGKAGAYLVSTAFALPPGQTRRWHIVADVNQNSAAVTRLVRLLKQDRAEVEQQLEADITQGTTALMNYVAAADGLQVSAHETTTAHHFSNVLFNIMRGGIFANGYEVERDDLFNFMQVRNRAVLTAQADWFANLPAQMTIQALYTRAATTGSPDLIRLCYEYLPLTFSRRHGDPSRPWNQFSINLKQPDGSLRLDYQGNWRDIFQNWEPLALSFPAYAAGLIAKFLNATTADGYNPYRVTRDGIEWEVPEPDNPWANIGYWNDHQIIYLQKLLEIAEQVHPGTLLDLGNRPIFAYANVPYRLRSYQDMLADWYNTIDFDRQSHRAIEVLVSTLGTDGRLQVDSNGAVVHVTLTEKLLVLLLVKLTNLVPEGGIWMNTQRPEWNDANNALVGKGLSVVTAAYLRRFIAFWQARLLEGEGAMGFEVSQAVADLFTNVQTVLMAHQSYLDSGFNDQARQAIMNDLGAAITTYRSILYKGGLSTTQTEIPVQTARDFLALAQAYIEQTLRTNRREDGLYHAYNILRPAGAGMAIEHLYPMLEGQVAILSSGMLSSSEVLHLLRSLRQSDLYRADQHSYMLYPNRDLSGFRQKNNVTADQVADSVLVTALTDANDQRLLTQDDAGVYHFHGTFRNANDVARALDTLAQEPAYANLVKAERGFILELFETTFNHRAFTGRSGTFFAYEGLGSIYWHMVAKLLLAVQECYSLAKANGADTATVATLATAYYDIRQGLGFNKSPAEYGAFPTDPYSHTPAGAGARQPGMTGQVKEEILTRLGELGVSIRQGILTFEPALLPEEEFLSLPGNFTYLDCAGQEQTLSLPAHSLAFTFCQIPVIYTRGDKAHIAVTNADGSSDTIDGTHLDAITSRHIIDRDGQVQLLHVIVKV